MISTVISFYNTIYLCHFLGSMIFEMSTTKNQSSCFPDLFWASFVHSILVYSLNSNRNLLSECSYISRTISCSRSLPLSRNLSPNIFHVVNIYSYLKSRSYIFSTRTFLFAPMVEICSHLSLCFLISCTLLNLGI